MPFIKPENMEPQEESPADTMMNKSSAATAIHTPAGCRPTKAIAFLFPRRSFCRLAGVLCGFLRRFCAAFPCRLCILPLDLLLLHEAGKGIARNLRIVMQGFMVLKIHIRLERRFLCLCRRPVGFELVAVVALLDFPRPVLCAALCQFFGFVRPLNAGIVLFNGMYLVVDENTRFLCGAG